LIICQDNDNSIITNSKFTYQCNENTDNTLVCNSETIIPTTIPTTIQTTTISTQIDSTIPKAIPTTIANTFTTDILSSTLTIFPSTISTTISTILSTTIPTTVVKTTQTDIPIIIPIPNNNQTENIPIAKDYNNTKVILVGSSNYKRNSFKFSFYTHFASVENYLYSQTVTFNVLVDNEKVEAKCTLQDRELLSNAKYFCEIPTNSTDIKQISIEPDFKFDIQDNVTIVGITPFANMYMDNIQNIDPIYNYISDSNIYVIENSTKLTYNNNNINISGIMFNSKAEFTTKNFDLLITITKQIANEKKPAILKLRSEKVRLISKKSSSTVGQVVNIGENQKNLDITGSKRRLGKLLVVSRYLSSENKTQKNLQCSFDDVKEVNNNYHYTLNCSSNEILKGELQNGIAFIDKDILVVHFDNSTESEIEINTDEAQKTHNYKYYKKNKTKKSTIILSIILPLTILLVSILTAIFVVRKIGKKNVEIRNEIANSTQIKLPS